MRVGTDRSAPDRHPLPATRRGARSSEHPMRLLTTTAFATGLALLTAGTATAGCGIAGGNVTILGNDFPAIQAVVTGAEECAGDGVSVSANLTTEHEELQI